MSGAEIFKKRKELRAFHPCASYKTTQIAVTTIELNPALPIRSSTVVESFDTSFPRESSLRVSPHQDMHKHSSSSTISTTTAAGNGYEQYSINIASAPVSSRPSMPPSMVSAQARKRAAMEVNRAASGYTKVALLFFLSLLVTWVRAPFL